jgi:tetratricopeptide (TPR) repeat protein
VYCSPRRSLILASILLAACARKPGPTGPDRIAILRFENMSGDLSADWQGRALSEVLIQELGGIQSNRLHAFDRVLGVHPASAPGISAESTQAIVAGATQIGYGEFAVRDGKLQARLTVEDPRTLKVVKVAEAIVPAGDVLGAAASLTRQITSKPAPYGTRSNEALMHYTRAIETADAASTERELEQAVAADPDFSAAYIPLAQTLAQRRERAGAMALLERGLARPGTPETSRTRFEVELAELRGDSAGRMAALAKLARLEPSDGTVWHALGDVAMARHEYTQARQAYDKAVVLAPQDADLLNSLGYAAAQSGDLDAAVSALKRYRALRPKDANPFDSLGDAYLVSGRLGEAESYYLEAQKLDPTFLNNSELLKAAVARLLTGDVSAADKLASQYFDARRQAKDPATDYRRAQWDWITGRRRQAMRELESFARGADSVSTLRDAASRAWSDLAVWQLMLDDRSAAAQSAQKAITLATPASAGNAVVSRFVSLPEATAAEWASRANQQFGAQTPIRNIALAYALLLSRQLAAAQSLLEPMWHNGAPLTDEGLPVLLGWCYLETGKTTEAESLLRLNPIPPAGGPGAFSGMYLPRLFYLRGTLAAKAGRPQEARTEYRKFLDLSGPDGLIWGEEKKAQAVLNAR